MKDRHNRHINYMRLSVTDHCNLRCFYCAPHRNLSFLAREEILTYEELLRLARLALEFGITRFRITGGEPLLRQGLPFFIKKLIELKGAEDISLTTNGLLLLKHLNELWEAGLRRLNISLDTLDEQKYTEITGGGDIRIVLRGMEEALKKGFSPLKLNVILLKGINDDPWPFIRLAYTRPIHVRFIELMEFSPLDDFFLSGEECRKRLTSYGMVEETTPPLGSGPARYYKLKGMMGSIGFIFPYSEHFCSSCNRLRISADGKLRPCLFSDWTVDLKEILRNGISDQELKKVLQKAFIEKPRSRLEANGGVKGKGLREIGG